MSITGFPLSCFNKPALEQEGWEIFVCNGGGGVAGVRRKDDKRKIVFVRNTEIAQNLNMQRAKRDCGSGHKFAVHGDPAGITSFVCEGNEMEHKEDFKAASKADWAKYAGYLK